MGTDIQVDLCFRKLFTEFRSAAEILPHHVPPKRCPNVARLTSRLQPMKFEHAFLRSVPVIGLCLIVMILKLKIVP